MREKRDTKDMNYDRAKIFCRRQIKVHISKTTGTFLNGIITEVRPEFFFLDDIIAGEQLVFFQELNKPIEQFKNKEEGEDEKKMGM